MQVTKAIVARSPSGTLAELNPTRRLYSVARRLTGIQSRVVDEYLIDLDPTATGERCGISRRRVETMLKLPYVAEAIAIAMRQRSERTKVTVDKVVQEFAKIGFASMGDYLRDTPDGDPYLDLSKLTADQKAPIKHVEVTDVLEGRGEDQRTVRRVKFELHDKLAALNALGRHLNMFEEHKRVTLTIEQRVANMTREERLAHMRTLLTPMQEFLSELNEAEEQDIIDVTPAVQNNEDD